MANADTRITLDALHSGMVAAIKAKFPTLKTVEAYRLDRKNLPLPACLIELTEFDDASDGHDMGTGQSAVNARFEAHLVMNFKQGLKNEKLEIRKLAAAFAAFIRLNRFGLPIGAAEFIGAHPDDFNPEFDQFECWKVEWQHQIDIGDVGWAEYEAPTTQAPSWKPQLQTNGRGGYTPQT